MERRTIYVDMDGTLLDGSHDAKFIASGYNITWYDAQYADGLAVNYRLVRVLVKLRARGHKLILWTNRGQAQVAMTQANLGGLWYLFDEHQFHSGKKYGTNLDGYTIDNETKYVDNGIIIKGF